MGMEKLSGVGESTTVLSRFLGDPDPVIANKKSKTESATRKDEVRVEKPPKKRRVAKKDKPTWILAPKHKFDTSFDEGISLALRRTIIWTCISDIVEANDTTEWSLRHCIITHVSCMIDTLHGVLHYVDSMYMSYAAWSLLHCITLGTKINSRSFPDIYEQFTEIRLDTSYMKIMHPLLNYLFANMLTLCRNEISRNLTLRPVIDELTSLGTLATIVAVFKDRRLIEVPYIGELCSSVVLMLTKGLRDQDCDASSMTRLSKTLGLELTKKYTKTQMRRALMMTLSISETSSVE